MDECHSSPQRPLVASASLFSKMDTSSQHIPFCVWDVASSKSRESSGDWTEMELLWNRWLILKTPTQKRKYFFEIVHPMHFFIFSFYSVNFRHECHSYPKCVTKSPKAPFSTWMKVITFNGQTFMYLHKGAYFFYVDTKEGGEGGLGILYIVFII